MDYLVKRIQALERALQGKCFACKNAEPPKIRTVSGFPNMSYCEHRQNVLASTGVMKCGHWEFDQKRFSTEQDILSPE